MTLVEQSPRGCVEPPPLIGFYPPPSHDLAPATRVPPMIRPPETALQWHRAVCCNGKALDPNQLHVLDLALGGTVPDGSYWYDVRWGVFGRVGEARERSLPASLDLGGPAPANASLGNSGVFINGRQLGFVELSRTPGIPYLPRRRYWVNANGDFGIESSLAIMGNLNVKAAQAVMLNQLAVSAQSVSHAGGRSGPKESARLPGTGPALTFST